MEAPEICIFFSDQHDARLVHALGNEIVRTPNLDRLVAEGTACTNAYTSYPLCVPARMSFLTGCLPSRTGVTSNGSALASDRVTLAHSLALAGYDTVLCGRMHFVGPDQRHGFTERYVGDMTPVLWHRVGIDDDRGEPFTGNFGQRGCLRSIGTGNSPVLEYDSQVVDRAVDHFSDSAPGRERPGLTVVGTYGPHFPYAAPAELYEYYYERLGTPERFGEAHVDSHPVIGAKQQLPGPERARQARAAYYAMVEELDAHVGRVKAAFDAYCARTGREGLFIYMSDHGDTNGEHNLYGKVTFYEGSARIPLVWSGAGIAAGVRIESPVSIMDVAPTLCELAGAEALPWEDGVSIASQLSTGADDPGRVVVSEVVDSGADQATYAGRMVRRGRWKLVTYGGLADHDRLYDIDADPFETVDRSAANPSVREELRDIAYAGWNPAEVAARHDESLANQRLIARWWTEHHPEHDERWRPPPGIAEQFRPV